MKILHTTAWYYPSIGGMQEVVRQLSERLTRLGHEVTVVTAWQKDRQQREINGVKVIDFNISGNAVRGFKGDTQGYEKFLLESNFDIVVNFAAQQWATDLALPLLDRIHGKKIFVPTGFSGLYDPQYEAYFSEMAGWMKKYDMNVFLSNDYRDINFAREHGIDKILLIPNGAGEEFLDNRLDFRQVFRIPADMFMILHVGSYTELKGHAEAIEIFKSASLKNACLVMISDSVGWRRAVKAFSFNMSAGALRDRKRLSLLVVDRLHTVAAYQAADLFLFPSNIECSPLVLFECMASRTPFLTTEVGNAREIIEWSHAGEILPTIREGRHGNVRADILPSVRALEGIYADSQRRKQLSEAGFAAWEKRFQWQVIVKAYEQLYKSVLG